MDSTTTTIPAVPPPPFYYQHPPYGTLIPEDPDPPKPPTTSPWHRMKWTDHMVELLIQVVFEIGDDGALEGEPTSSKSKKTAVTVTAACLKKGKWKSVSKEMMGKGFYVSPQQCEDKFNDLNKRYKRVTELLGRGTACRVVENHSLLEAMDLNPRAKEEARKLLNSKHLFFPQMCAYHNGGVVHGPHGPAAVAAPPPQGCSHRSPGSSYGRGEYDSEDDEMDVYEEEDDEDDVGFMRQPALPTSPQLSLSLWSGAPAAGPMQREWMKRKVEVLEEQRVGYQSEALRIEWRRFRWDRYRGDKEREMERRRLENERMRLENERMLLMLRKRELEIGSNGGGASASSVSVQLSGERGQQGVAVHSNVGMEHHFLGGGCAARFDV